MKKNKSIFVVIGRALLILMAVLFILIGIAGIGGVWGVNRTAVNVTLKTFSIVDVGVSVAESGVEQALTNVKTDRVEIAQTEEDIKTLGQHLQDNHPALVALNERLETKLGPSVDKLQSLLEPVRDGLIKMDSVLTVVNSIPSMNEKAPGLQNIQDALDALSELSADVRQLRTTMNAAAEGQADALTEETTSLLLTITGRIDQRLARLQTNLEQVQAKVDALQENIAQKKARLLFLYNMVALLFTLLLLWLIYSQVVMIWVQVRKLRGYDCMKAPTAVLSAPDDVSTASLPAEAASGAPATPVSESALPEAEAADVAADMTD